MANLVKDDWEKIHAKAWRDPDFRFLLETDPTAAIKCWANENKLEIDKIVDLSDWIRDDESDFNHGPPSCC
jgi:hypothetical protein